MKLFLDDSREPSMVHRDDGWTIVRDYFEFVKIVDNYFDEIELVSFDHDLACFENGVEYTGKSAAVYLSNYCIDHNKKFPNWYVHTGNPVGRLNIIDYIIHYLKFIEGEKLFWFSRQFNNGIINGEFV